MGNKPQCGMDKPSDNASLASPPSPASGLQDDADTVTAVTFSPSDDFDDSRQHEDDDSFPISHNSSSTPNVIPSRTSSTFGAGAVRDAEAMDCSLCGSSLGKRRMKPRHHCRICLQVVCNTCSPNAIQFDGERGTQRCCNACAANAQKAPAMRSRLEQVAEKIRMVSGSTGDPGYTFAGMLRNRSDCSTACFGENEPVVVQNLEDAVSTCEFAASTLIDAFHSHETTKVKIQEIESEIVEQKAARDRLETVAQRVDEAENEVAEERQARKQLEAKVRLGKNDCVRLAERLCTISGAQALPSRTASLEDAIVSCDSAVVRIEAQLEEERRMKKEIENARQEAVASRERQAKSLQAEIMKLRADVLHERKLREAVEDSVLNTTSSRHKTSVGGSLSPRSSLAEALPESERLLYQGLAGAFNGQSITPARTPPRMHSVHEHHLDNNSGSACGRDDENSSEFESTMESRPSCARLGQCKSSCAVQ